MKGQSEEFGVAVVIGVLAARPRRSARSTAASSSSPASRTSSSRWRCRSSGPAARSSSSRRPAAARRTGSRTSSSARSVVEWIPKAAVVLVVIVAVIWIPLRRSRLGLSIYAIGSNRLAAFRSGVAGRPDEDRRLRAHRPVRGARRPVASPRAPASGRPVPGPYTLHERRRGRPRRRQPRRRPGRRLRPDRRASSSSS